MRYPCSLLRPTRIFYYFTFFYLLVLLTASPAPRAAEPFLRDWTPCTPSDRNFPAMVEFNHEYWIFGGKSTNIYRSGWPLNDVWKCSSLADWKQVTAAAPFSPRSKAKALVIDHKIWLVGGEDSRGKFCNDLWITSDGLHWTSHTLRIWTPTANIFCYRNGLGINAGGFCPTTQDGDVWQDRFSAYYNGYFCLNETTLIGYNSMPYALNPISRYLFSQAERAVTKAANRPMSDFYGLSFTINNTSYYCSTQNQFYSTTDGENWKTLGTFTPPGLATTQTLLLTQNSRFEMTDGLSQLWTSTDTLHWQNISDRLPPTKDPCYAQNDRGQTLAIVNVSGTLRIFRSTDSCHWQAIGELATSSQYNTLTLTWFRGAYYLLNLYEPGIIRRSVDGRTWPVVAQFNTMTYWNSIYPFTLEDRLYVSGYAQGSKMYSSTDGFHWDEFPGALPYPNIGLPPLEYRGRTWALAKPSMATWSLTSSDDMTHWTTHTLPTAAGWPLAFKVLRSKLVMISEFGAYTSTDASLWEKQYAFPPLEMDLDYIMCLPAPKGLYLYSFDLSYGRYITRQAWFTPFQANATAPAWNLYP